jgi:hypothetical protein
MWRTTAKKKKRKTKLVFNQLGCIDVGQPCAGKAHLCCSGICEGKKPKKGKKDKRRCASHDVGGCLANQDSCETGAIACTTSANKSGFCQQTTGGASYCAASGAGDCAACTKDADCEEAFGPGAACIVCGGIGCEAEGDRLCVGLCLPVDAECTNDKENCCEGACRQIPSLPTFTCRKQNCLGAGVACVTTGDCCQGLCASDGMGFVRCVS